MVTGQGLHGRHLPLSGQGLPEMIQNLRMVKDQWLRQGVHWIKGGLGRVVPGADGVRITRLARKNHGKRVLAGIALGP